MVFDPTYPLGPVPLPPRRGRRRSAAPLDSVAAGMDAGAGTGVAAGTGVVAGTDDAAGAAAVAAGSDVAGRADIATGKDAAAGPARRRRVNTSSKGTQVELLAIKLLEAEGYKVHRCIRTGQRRGPIYVSQSNDVFGCIDLVAKKLGHRTRWIQVTADGGIGRKRREMDEVPWDPEHDAVEIWRWVGGRRRRSKVDGTWLERQYFQVYHFDDGYTLRKDRRIAVAPGNDTIPSEPYDTAHREMVA